MLVKHVAFPLVALVVVLLLLSCQEEPEDGTSPYGPLAVMPPQQGTDFALAGGTLIIKDDCVLLDERGEFTLLVWPADRTGWDPETRTITFRRLNGALVLLQDGDQVQFGGGGSGEGEGGVPAADWAETFPWVSPPKPECLVESQWFVGEVVAS